MSIEISGLYTTSPNSANGVGVSHYYFNAGDEDIKYLTFTYVPYNSVDDIVASSVGGESEVNCRITGPISPKTESRAQWEILWYNPTIVKAKITKVHIIYMDNSEETIDGENIKDMYHKESVYWKEIGEKEKKEREEREAREKEREAREKEREKELEKERKKELEEKKRNALKKGLKYAYIFCGVFAHINAIKQKTEYPEDKMEVAKLHANQGLVLFIIEIIGIILWGNFPILGKIVIAIAIALSVLGILGLKKDESKGLPLLSKIKFIK